MPEQTFQVGDIVRVKEPFSQIMPATYMIMGTNPETGALQIMKDGELIDFDPSNLEHPEG